MLLIHAFEILFILAHKKTALRSHSQSALTENLHKNRTSHVQCTIQHMYNVLGRKTYIENRDIRHRLGTTKNDKYALVALV